MVLDQGGCSLNNQASRSSTAQGMRWLFDISISKALPFGEMAEVIDAQGAELGRLIGSIESILSRLRCTTLKGKVGTVNVLLAT